MASVDGIKLGRAWIGPVVALVAGSGITVGVAALLNISRLPAMAAVDEVHLVVPDTRSVQRAEPKAYSSDWSKGASPRMRGNAIDVMGGESAFAATVPTASRVPTPETPRGTPDSTDSTLAADPNIRWFNARPVRPARTIWMTVTGYSPDERSCGDSADGLTATMHSVTTNAMKLVAADPKVLAYGSMISVPGYDEESIVPVLDCGGAIKGDSLDLLFPTHDEARRWGRQRILVTVWEFADGKPAENVRKLR